LPAPRMPSTRCRRQHNKAHTDSFAQLPDDRAEARARRATKGTEFSRHHHSLAVTLICTMSASFADTVKVPHVQWVPKQHKQSECLDLRGAQLGPTGYKMRNKRKLEEMRELEQEQQADMAAEGVASDSQWQGAGPAGDEQSKRGNKRFRVESNDGVPYIPVRGNVWRPRYWLCQNFCWVLPCQAWHDCAAWYRSLVELGRQRLVEQQRS
jgi:hypothetical protein